MRKLILLVALLPTLALGQDAGVTHSGNILRPSAGQAGLVRICTETASGQPCYPTVTMFSDAALSIPLTVDAQGWLATDANGNFENIWVAPGTYIEQTRVGTDYHTKFITVGGTSGGGGGLVNHNLLSEIHTDTIPATPPAMGDWIMGNAGSKWQAQHGNTSTTPQFMMSVGNGSAVVSQGFTTVGAPCSGGQFANGINNDLTPSCATVTVPNQITPPPPFPVPGGQAVAWAFPATSVYGPGNVGATNGNAYSTPSYGYVTMTSSSSLGNWTWGAQWQGFAMPTLPNDAVIQGIYGVMVASRVGGGRAACGTTKPSLYTESTGWTGTNFNWPSGNTLGEYYTTTLGSTSSTVTSMICAIQEFQTNLQTYNPPLQVTAYSMVLAIYYTTASPPQNSQYTLPVPSSYSNLLGVSATYASLTDGNPITFDAQGNYIYSGTVTLAHTLSTRALNVANLQTTGSYTVELVQDSTGAAKVTAGSGCTWLNPDGSPFVPTINPAAGSRTTLHWRFDGTYCTVDQTLGGVNGQTGTSYTLTAADAGGYVRMNNASANTVTIPPNSSVAFSIGTVISINQVGAGQTSLVAGAGVTINTPSTLNARVQRSTISVTKVGTDEWDASGDLQ